MRCIRSWRMCLAGWASMLLAGAVTLGGGGCGSDAPTSRYVPAAVDAESALQTALRAWEEGTAPGPVPNTSPVIHVTDSFRRSGERLEQFRILGEVPGDTPRCFAVELRFDPPRQEKARYVIVGIDPLWVFRLEDYQLIAHWEHRMDEGPPPAGSQPAAGGRRPGDE